MNLKKNPLSTLQSECKSQLECFSELAPITEAVQWRTKLAHSHGPGLEALEARCFAMLSITAWWLVANDEICTQTRYASKWLGLMYLTYDKKAIFSNR